MMNENPMAIFQIRSFIWVKNSGGGLFRTLKISQKRLSDGYFPNNNIAKGAIKLDMY